MHSKNCDTIYNLFPIAITKISTEFPDFEEKKVQNIIKNLLTFIEKDKQLEAIIDRICQKLKKNAIMTEKIEQINFGYCLTQIKYSDRTFSKLIENHPNWKDRMVDSP